MTRTAIAPASAAARALRDLERLLGEREELLHRLESLSSLRLGPADRGELARLSAEAERLAHAAERLLAELEAVVPPARRRPDRPDAA